MTAHQLEYCSLGEKGKSRRKSLEGTQRTKKTQSTCGCQFRNKATAPVTSSTSPDTGPRWENIREVTKKISSQFTDDRQKQLIT